MKTESSPESDSTETAAPSGAGARRRKWRSALIVLGVLSLGGFLYYSNQPAPAANSDAKPPMRIVPVTVDHARKTDVGIYISGLGAVIPLNTVNVHSRVDGQLMEVHFKEGQIVERGDLLATIDPRLFQVQRLQAEGQMARDQELLKNARIDYQRYKVLWGQDSISKQQLDTQESLVRQYEAAIKIDQGLIENANLQLTYTRITAPTGGRVGLRQVDPGNIIHAADANGLVVITRIQPISVVFSIPEDNLPQVLARLKDGTKLKVEAYDREMKHLLTTGTLLTLDNQIDPSTGTVKLKAEFANRNSELFPNQFVNARLLIEVRHGAVVVPSAAVQRGQQGAFVYVVNAEETARVRPVSLGVTQGDDTAISEGVSPGEAVVVAGAEGLRDGSKVAVKGAENPQNNGDKVPRPGR